MSVAPDHTRTYISSIGSASSSFQLRRHAHVFDPSAMAMTRFSATDSMPNRVALWHPSHTEVRE